MTAPAPADLASNAHLRVADLCALYKVGRCTLQTWLAEAGITRQRHRAGRATPPLPANYAEKANRHSIEQLTEIYGQGRYVIRRWDLACGVSRKRFGERVQAKAKAAAPKKVRGLVLIAVDRFTRDLSQAGQAADYLRRFGPVVRCDEKGRYKADGQHWRRGSTILTADEIVERAERNGWNPDAWRQVA